MAKLDDDVWDRAALRRLRAGDSLDFDLPEGLDEDSESFDPDRWLHFQPESGEGYRDLLDFASGLPDGQLREGFQL